MNNKTIEMLREIKTIGMAEALEIQLEQPNTYSDLSFIDRLEMLVDQEKIYRENKKISRLTKNAKFKLNSTIEDIDYSHPRGLSKNIILEIINLNWINAKQNILITGPTGCGKTFISCAIGHFSCSRGFSVFYYRASRLFEKLVISHGDGTYYKLMKQLSNTDLLIIDDWGLDQLSLRSRNDLLEIMEDRHNNKSTIITSQLPTIKWHEVIGDATLADAILDRLLHNAYKLKLSGESMRKIKRNLTAMDQ